MNTASRIFQAVSGATLVVAGASGLIFTPAGLATGAVDGGDSRTAMEQMMTAMHDDEVIAGMLEIEGADEMLDRCAEMMDTMGSMSGMMNRGGMRDMMGTGGMMDSPSAR